MIQSSIFGKHSRFHWDFHNDLDNSDYWDDLSQRYESWLTGSFQCASQHFKIPKIIHQIWLGPNPLPDFYEKFAMTWKYYNPDFEYRLWTDDNICNINLTNPQLFNAISNYGAKSDLLRYELLYQFGGLYVDVDFECVAPVSSKMLVYDFVACLQFNSSPEVGNAFLMSAPHSNIIKQIVSQCSMPKKDDAFDIFVATGPYLVSSVVEKHLSAALQEFLILPSNYVYPFPSFLASEACDPHSFLTAESFAIHYWNMSWMSALKPSLRTRIKQFLKYLIVRD